MPGFQGQILNINNHIAYFMVFCNGGGKYKTLYQSYFRHSDPRYEYYLPSIMQFYQYQGDIITPLTPFTMTKDYTITGAGKH